MMKSGGGHGAAVQVRGIVSAVFPRQRVFLLIDTAEFQECGVTTCASLALPVRWNGIMPVAKDDVRVRGSVQKTGGKLIFIALSLAKKPHSATGGSRAR